MNSGELLLFAPDGTPPAQHTSQGASPRPGLHPADQSPPATGGQLRACAAAAEPLLPPEGFRTLPKPPSWHACALGSGQSSQRPSVPPPLPSGSRPPSRGLQRACAVARAAGCGEGLKSAGHAQRRFWLWRGGRHIGSARGALRAAPGRYGARLAGPHAAAPGPRVAPLRARRAEASGCAVSGRRRGALAGP